eukprot:1261786-Rhodomonas_salina.3
MEVRSPAPAAAQPIQCRRTARRDGSEILSVRERRAKARTRRLKEALCVVGGAGRTERPRDRGETL